jgi:iron-sulfur cluster repair protein YtfE (RIC family)
LGKRISAPNRGRLGDVTAETEDLVSLLKADHKKLEETFAALDSLEDSQLRDYFCQVRQELGGHETAEQLVVYPAFRRHVPGPGTVADACVAEQSEAEAALARLERYGDEPVVVRAGLLQLRREVLAHVQHEERDILPALEAHMKPKALHELARRYAKALDSAPTHSHPHVADAARANIVLGPVEEVRDSIRETMKQSA